MKPALLPLLRCPTGCDAPLQLTIVEERAGEIETGCLDCPACGRTYPVQEGIARMLPLPLVQRNAGSDETLDESTRRKRSEMHARDEQVQDYDRMWYLNLFGLVEIPATLLALSLSPRHTLLEAGCGTGRMTRIFAEQCARLIAVDYSWESLRVCAGKLRRAGITGVDLVQADLCHLPFRAEVFDRVVSCQVLEHIPTPQSRTEAVCNLARVTRAGGNLVVSAYQYSFWMRLFGEKEGEHKGGIYFYRFTRAELRALLSTALTVEAITGALVYHYIARCRKE